MTKTQIKTITANQYLPSTSSTQSSSNTNTRLEMAYNCAINLTENNKSKPLGSQTWDNNLHAIANNSNK